MIIHVIQITNNRAYYNVDANVYTTQRRVPTKV